MVSLCSLWSNVLCRPPMSYTDLFIFHHRLPVFTLKGSCDTHRCSRSSIWVLQCCRTFHYSIPLAGLYFCFLTFIYFTSVQPLCYPLQKNLFIFCIFSKNVSQSANDSLLYWIYFNFMSYLDRDRERRQKHDFSAQHLCLTCQTYFGLKNSPYLHNQNHKLPINMFQMGFESVIGLCVDYVNKRLKVSFWCSIKQKS